MSDVAPKIRKPWIFQSQRIWLTFADDWNTAPASLSLPPPLHTSTLNHDNYFFHFPPTSHTSSSVIINFAVAQSCHRKSVISCSHHRTGHDLPVVQLETTPLTSRTLGNTTANTPACRKESFNMSNGDWRYSGVQGPCTHRAESSGFSTLRICL